MKKSNLFTWYEHFSLLHKKKKTILLMQWYHNNTENKITEVKLVNNCQEMT